MAQKPSIPKGTRDFSPEEMMRRNYIFDTVRAVFRTLRLRTARNARNGKSFDAAGANTATKGTSSCSKFSIRGTMPPG